MRTKIRNTTPKNELKAQSQVITPISVQTTLVDDPVALVDDPIALIGSQTTQVALKGTIKPRR